MRVRVWIRGPDGPSHDFELVTAPQLGERVVVNSAEGLQEGIVEAVTWHLQAVEAGAAEIALEGEPPGSVSLVQVVCRPSAPVLRGAFTAKEAIERAPLGSA
jgi:hypothetical protein